jgi:hypothetical protein
MIAERYLISTVLGVIFGVTTRFIMLRSDYRQYPGYPHGYITHLSLGFIASVLGGLAVPILVEKELPAIAFMSLAATQFRDIREIERKTLINLDQTNLVPRGPDYIEGIARVFESRNYLVMLTALIVSGTHYFTSFAVSMPVGAAALWISYSLMRGRVIGDIATVRPGEIHFEGPNLFVENIHFMNLAREEVRRTIMERGLGVVLEPHDDNARATLANNGQRMAIAHDAVTQLGIYKDVDTAEFTPVLRRDLDTGRIAMIILPLETDLECLLTAVRQVPVLESSLSRPLQSRAGHGAAD